MEAFKHLIRLLKHFTNIGPAGCAISISRGEEIVFEHYEGYADLESKRSICSDTLFRLYSNTKIATVTAMMQLYERGYFLLNDPVADYLPEYRDMKVGYFTGNNLYALRPAHTPMRIVDLLRMTSGLTYGAADPAPSRTHAAIASEISGLGENGAYTTREFASAMAKTPLLFEPGSSWNYGVGHDICGALIEEITGKAFGAYLKEEIFDPLGMEDTCFFLSDGLRNRLATCYTLGEQGKRIPFTSEDSRYNPANKFESGGAGLLSTLKDTAMLARMYACGGKLGNTRILGRKTIDLMRLNHLGTDALNAFRRAQENHWEFLKGYGYGMGVRTMMDRAAGGCNGSVGEFGWAGAAGTWMLMDPEEKLSIVYMHQLRPENMEGYCHPRIRAAVYAALDEL